MLPGNEVYHSKIWRLELPWCGGRLGSKVFLLVLTEELDVLSAAGWSQLDGVSDYVEAEEAALVGEDDGCEVDSPVA